MTDGPPQTTWQPHSPGAASTEFLQALVRTSRHGEAAVQAMVAERLDQLGCRVETIRYSPAEVKLVKEFASEAAMDRQAREAVVGRFSGTGGGRSLIFFAHPDGEPVAGVERWTHDPFAGTLAGGRLYGWGIADDLAGVAAAVDGLALVIGRGIRPRGDVIVASTPSKRHARGVAAVLSHGHTADGAVYLHPAESGEGVRDIKAFSSGILGFRITITGRPPETGEPLHTAFAHRAVDPIGKAMVICQALQAFAERRAAEVHHPALDAAIGRSTNIQLSYIHAGEEQNHERINETCVIGGSISFPPTEDLDDVQAAFAGAVERAAATDPWLRDHPPQVDWRFGAGGIDVPATHPLYRAVHDSVVAVAGLTPKVNPLHTGSDIRVPFLQKGIPTVGLGPLCGDLTQVGGHDEWVDADDYCRMVEIAAAVIVAWCGVVDR